MCFKFESVQRSCSARGPVRESVCPSRAFSKAVLNNKQPEKEKKKKQH